MSPRHQILAVAIVAAGILSGQWAIAGDTDPGASRLVQDALRHEADGHGAERDALLKATLEDNPDFPSARWQAGYVDADGQWRHVADPAPTPADAEAYWKVRDSYPATSEGQLDLANWCARHDLPEQERAHLTAALELSDDPNDPLLRSRLGFELVDGQWLARDDIRLLERDAKDTQKAFERWLPRLKKIADGLADDSKRARNAWAAKLKSINDPEAIPAMEAALSQRGLDTAHLLLATFANMKSHKASIALARQAAFSPYETVREQAARLLRSRPAEEYAPQLLALLQTPIESKTRLFVSSSGVQLTRELLRETQEFKELAVFESRTRFQRAHAGFAPRGTWPLYRTLNDYASEQAAAAAATRAGLHARAEARQVDVRNEETQRRNAHIMAALAAATGVEVPDTPEAWWAWWDHYNDLYRMEEKPWVVVIEHDESIEPIPQWVTSSCLAAGTRVWTDRGAVPVETVRVGDLALAKHPESGELTYKPVLRTTVRPANSLVKVEADGTSFTATGGHTFWISGRGWMKIRDVQPGMQFHGATGPVAARLVERAGDEPVYNLVVADFHTYFVGDAMILSHDPTFAQPTDMLVKVLLVADGTP